MIMPHVSVCGEYMGLFFYFALTLFIAFLLLLVKGKLNQLVYRTHVNLTNTK
jgi:hypothetical protein